MKIFNEYLKFQVNKIFTCRTEEVTRVRPEDVGYDQARPLSLVTITFVMNMNMVLVKGQRL